MPSSKSFLWLCLTMASVMLLTGCSGCKQDPLVERNKKLEEERKKKKPKEDFEFKLARTVPADDTVATPFVKPGHWMTVANEIKANNFNFQAELHTTSTDRNERPHFVRYTPFKLVSSRPAPLPKGQEKRFETIYFIPEIAADEDETVGLHRELRAARGGRLLKKDWQPVADMEPYQYFLMVLSSNAQRYSYLKTMPSIAAPTSDTDNYDRESFLYYRVLMPELDRIAPLPSNPLTWTSIAYILWDDANPAMLTRDQQIALLDWLHWGGQLIISGPNSLDKLKGTFLEEYLPASFVKAVEIDQAAVDELNQAWSLPNKKTGGVRSLNVLPSKPLVGIEIEKHPDANFLADTGQLVVERRIGGGRIVATAFSLTDRAIVRWTSYDSFFNACILRRPRREFDFQNLMLDCVWKDYNRRLTSDARLTTTLRYFSRDIGHFASSVQRARKTAVTEETAQPSNSVDARQTEEREDIVIPEDVNDPPGDDWHFQGYPLAKQGMAAWNDQSGASDASREALKVAAGISIPRGDFVLKVLVVYLIVLAPVNWAIFRLIGRVEWAWVAAPILAIIGAVVVIRLAQLDIGFARSVTEVAIAEVQGDYPRAHITRYSAMYTSLSSSYDVVFDDEASLASPFGANTDHTLGLHDATYTVSLRRDRNLRLSGFQVASNDVESVHMEQMAEFGGSFRLIADDGGGLQINNATPLSLTDAGLLRRTESGALEVAWLGKLPASSIRPVRFKPAEGKTARLPEWDESPATFSFDRQADGLMQRYDRDRDKKLAPEEVASHPEISVNFLKFDEPPRGGSHGDGIWTRDELLNWCRESRFGEVSVGRLVDLASEGIKLRRGDSRLIGWTDEPMPGMTIRPTAAQATRRTLFIVHVSRGQLPDAKPDTNTRLDFMEERPAADLKLFQEMTTPGEGNASDNAPAASGTTNSDATPADSQ
ncbi:MAG: hypothetical protein CMJ64_19135 [Planctomycetaceae bacterium]|nr:hypothetical protein [Planctomycetaceae bacterium]